jgi:hypothetical protein
MAQCLVPDQGRLNAGFSYSASDIHNKNINYAQPRFNLYRETRYSGLVSSTLPKDGSKPAVLIPVGFFLARFPAIKEKPATHNHGRLKTNPWTGEGESCICCRTFSKIVGDIPVPSKTRLALRRHRKSRSA